MIFAFVQLFLCRRKNSTPEAGLELSHTSCGINSAACVRAPSGSPYTSNIEPVEGRFSQNLRIKAVFDLMDIDLQRALYEENESSELNERLKNIN